MAGTWGGRAEMRAGPCCEFLSGRVRGLDLLIKREGK